MDDFTEYFQTLWKDILNLSVKDFKITQYQIQLIIVSNLIWWLLYGFIHFFIPITHKTKKEVNDTKTRIVSIIHATYATILAFIDFFYNQTSQCGQYNNDLQNFILCTSLGYFLYDTIACILLDVSDIEMVIHHLSVMLGYYSGISFNHSAAEMLRGLLVADVSNPIMHMRMIVRNYGMKHTKLYLNMDIVYMFIYIIARSIFGAMSCYFTVFCKGNLFIVKIAGFSVWAQSVLFMRRMLDNLRHRYLDYLERREKGIEYHWFEFNKKIEELDYYKRSIKKHKEKYVPNVLNEDKLFIFLKCLLKI